MWRGIRAVQPGAYLGDGPCDPRSLRLGYSVWQFCGHGIGQRFMKNRVSTCITLNAPGSDWNRHDFTSNDDQAGKADIKQLGDCWTVVTKDQ